MTHTFNIKIDTEKQIVQLMQPIGDGMVNAVKVSYQGKKLKHGLEFVSDLMRETVRQDMLHNARHDN